MTTPVFPRGYRPPAPARPRSTARQYPLRTAAAVLLVGTLGFYGVIFASGKDVAGAFAAIPILVLFTLPVLAYAARSEARFDLAGILGIGLLVRFLAAYYRFTHAADSILYHRNGVIIAQHLRQYDFGVDTGAAVPGTGGLRYIAGVVEVFTGSNQFATFLVFAWLGFLACWCFYLAFRIALPDAGHRRYALLLFLWPSLVFWPSSIGKDCWMILAVGLASLGAARVFMRLRGGYTLMLLGFAAGSVVRPHVMLIVLIAFVVALAIGRRAPKPGVTPSGVAKVAGLVLLILVGTFLVGRTQSLVGGSGVGDFDTVLTQTAGQTQQGTSAFSPPNPRTPFGYVESVVTVLFRPFPFETSGLEQIAAGLEGLFLVVLVVRSWRRIITIPRRLRAEPYVTYALVYVGVFIFVFAAIANFGILARERSMLIPMVLALLSLPKTLPRAKAPPPRFRSLPMRARAQAGDAD